MIQTMLCVCLIFFEDRELVRGDTHGVWILSNFRNHQFSAVLEPFFSSVCNRAFVLSVVLTQLVTRKCPTPWIVNPIG